MRAVGLFSGIGGLVVGPARAGIGTQLLCEFWEPAATTLALNTSTPRSLVTSVNWRFSLLSTDVVTAGFPCTDLSQVGDGWDPGALNPDWWKRF